MGLAGPGGVPIPTPRGAATQLPPSAAPPKTVTVAAHTRAAPGAKAGKPAPATSPLSATLPGVDQEAALRAQLAVTPSVQAAQAAQAQDAANTAAQAKLLAGYYGALGPLLSQIAPSVQAGYQQAAGTDAMLGSAFGGQLNQQDAQNAQQAVSILQGQGAPAGQITAAQNAAGSLGLGDALGWLNAGLPAQGLAQAGAAYGAAARMLPASVAGIGGQEIAQTNTIGANQQTAEQQKITNALDRIPGLINTYAPSIQRQDLAAIAAQEKANTPKTFGDAAAGYYAYDPATGKITQVTQPFSPPKTFGNTQTGYFSINPQTGAVTQLTKGTGAPIKTFGSSSAGYYLYNPATGEIQQVTKPVVKPASATHDTPNVTISRSTGYVAWVDGNGQVHYATDAKGNPIPYKSATSASTKAKAANGGLTTSEISNIVTSYASGKPHDVRVPAYKIDPNTGQPALDKQGQPIPALNSAGAQEYTTQTQTTGQRSFSEAVIGLVGLGVSRPKALNAVLSNPTYFTQAQTAVTNIADEYARRGVPRAKALQETRATGVFPNSLIVPAINAAYAGARAKAGLAAGATSIANSITPQFG